jgi:hypothetical protein
VAIPQGIAMAISHSPPGTKGKENWTDVPDEEADSHLGNGVPN